MKNLKYLTFILIVSCAQFEKPVKLYPASKVNWEKLNPARGNKSPQAGTLWGDRKSEVPTAFLAKFVKGFSSPPHIHNVSYRGIVIEGLVHNDDPKAKYMWMPAGSYWTQPAGENHITAAKGKNNIAFIEIDQGPYLVGPSSKAFDNGEQAFNIHADKIQWKESKGYQMVDLWKNKKGEVTGSMIKFKGERAFDLESSQVVVIKGNIQLQKQQLIPGSFMSAGDKLLELTCLNQADCLIYIKWNADNVAPAF